MSKSVNKVILVGNLGKDPELKYTPGGVAFTKFSVATNEGFKDRQGQWQDRPQWHNIIAFQRMAEIAAEYLKKGRSFFELFHPRGMGDSSPPHPPRTWHGTGKA